MSLGQKKRRRSMGWLQRHAREIWMLQRVIDSAIAVGTLWVLGLLFKLYFSTPYIILMVLTALIMWPVFESAGLYYSYRSEHPGATYPRIWMAWASVFTLLLLIGYVTQTSAYFSRMLLFSWFLATPVALCFHHLKLRMLLRQIRATGLNSRKAVIAGTGELSRVLSQQFRDSPQFGLQFCGFFAETPLAAMTEIVTKPLIGTIEELPDYVRQNRIDVVYIAMALQESEKVSQLIDALKDTTVCVYFVPNITAFSLMQAKVQNFDGVPLIAIAEVPVMTVQILAKRLTDILVSGGTLLLLSPLLLGAAIALKATTPGSILVKQERYGFHGKRIAVYRFRTERNHAGIGLKRTRVGRFLEKTGIASLPQLFNVLLGDMSIVGPRPQVLAHCELYHHYNSRLRLGEGMKPGLTGWAQIHGFCGEHDTQETLQQQVAYDLDYLQNWSFWLDLKIMAKTTLTLLHRQNAY